MFHKDRKDVQEHTKHNEREVRESDTCGCLSCAATLKPDEITEWTDQADQDHPETKVDRTAVCPHCGEEMIIGDRSGHQITNTFLESLRNR